MSTAEAEAVVEKLNYGGLLMVSTEHLKSSGPARVPEM